MTQSVPSAFALARTHLRFSIPLQFSSSSLSLLRCFSNPANYLHVLSRCPAPPTIRDHTRFNRVWCSGNIVDSHFSGVTALSTAPGSTPGIRVLMYFLLSASCRGRDVDFLRWWGVIRNQKMSPSCPTKKEKFELDDSKVAKEKENMDSMFNVSNLLLIASAANRTRGPSMATMDFTTKPLTLLVLLRHGSGSCQAGAAVPGCSFVVGVKLTAGGECRGCAHHPA